MPRFTAVVTTAAALANGNAVAGVDPAAAINCKILQIILGIVNSGGAVTDFEVLVGINRATARGTATTTVSGSRSDPNSSASGITGLDTVYSVQPTLAAADAVQIPFNSRGGATVTYTEGDLMSTVGTANPIVFVQRSGAALPASHSISLSLEWFE